MLWMYACDHCDNIGLVELDFEFVSRDCGIKITNAHVTEIGNRIESLEGGKYFLPKFIKFQYGQLSASCPAHKKVIQAVEDHCLLHDSLGYHYPNARVAVRVATTLQDNKSTGKEEEEEGKAKKDKGTLADVIEFVTSLGLPRSDAESCFHKWEGNGWTNGGEKIKDWKATIRSWKAAKYLPSQKSGNGTNPRTNGQTPKFTL